MTSPNQTSDEQKPDQTPLQVSSLGGTRTRVHVAFAAVGAVILFTLLLAIPNCNRMMLQRAQRGTQMGVKADLWLLMEREAAFHARNGFYTTDLQALGIGEGKELIVLYKFGFVKADADEPKTAQSFSGQSIALDPARKDLDALKKLSPQSKIEYSTATALSEIQFEKLGSYCQDCTATKDHFRAIAAANLDDDATLDVWTVDEKGTIAHLVDDLSF